jgi:hypothetical protein
MQRERKRDKAASTWRWSSRSPVSKPLAIRSYIHQQVNVTEGGQAVVAGDTVTRGQGERRRGMIEK